MYKCAFVYEQMAMDAIKPPKWKGKNKFSADRCCWLAASLSAKRLGCRSLYAELFPFTDPEAQMTGGPDPRTIPGIGLSTWVIVETICPSLSSPPPRTLSTNLPPFLFLRFNHDHTSLALSPPSAEPWRLASQTKAII
jgi:hypothetical protein